MLAAFAAGIAGASAQTFPTQPIHLVVPFPPGGGTDALARAIQEPFQKALGQTVIIDNRGGGGGSIGHEITAKAAARRLHDPDEQQQPDAAAVSHRPSQLRSRALRADRLRRQAGVDLRRRRRCAVEGSRRDHRGCAQGAGRRAVRHGRRQHADAPVDRALRHPEQDQADARAVPRHRSAGDRSCWAAT